MRTVCRRLLLLSGCLVAAASLPGSALADGAPSIAAAPLVVYGQQQFGNTATGGVDTADSCDWVYSSNWLLSVTAGDRVTIDWEIQAFSTDLFVYPLGTNDFNVRHAGPFDQDSLSSNGRGELAFSAPASGNLPLVFQGHGNNGVCEGQNSLGPYDFTAYVRHVVRLALPRLSSVHPRASVVVAVHTAEGGAISDPTLLLELQIKIGRSWIGVGSAPVSNAVATVPLNIPLRYVGRVLSLRAVAHGGSYLNAATRSRSVVVTMKPKPKARGNGPKHHAMR